MTKKKTNQVPTKSYYAFLRTTAPVYCAEYATTMKKPLTVSIIWQCPELTKTDYLGSHNKAAAYVYPLEGMLALQHRSLREVVWAQATILWDMEIPVDRELSVNKPDI